MQKNSQKEEQEEKQPVEVQDQYLPLNAYFTTASIRRLITTKLTFECQATEENN